MDNAQVNLRAAEVRETLELLLESLVPPELNENLMYEFVQNQNNMCRFIHYIKTYRFVVKFAKSFNG